MDLLATEKMLTMKMPRIPPKHKKDVSHVNFTKLMPPLAVFQVENSVPDSPSSLTEREDTTAHLKQKNATTIANASHFVKDLHEQRVRSFAKPEEAEYHTVNHAQVIKYLLATVATIVLVAFA